MAAEIAAVCPPQSKPRLVHLFNAFEVGGVERQHMMLVERLAPRFEQACWSYIHGPLEAELDALCIPHRAGDFAVLRDMLDAGTFDCAVVRTNRHAREVAAYFASSSVPVVYVRSFLRWFEGNDTHFDPEFERLSYAYPEHVFFSGPSLQRSARKLGIPITGGEILFNGVDMARFCAAPRTPPPQDAPLRVGILANIAPHKNQLAAVTVLRPGMEAGWCTLHLAGEEQYPDYARQVREAAAGLPVEFRGYVAQAETFYDDIDVLLLTSTREGWPTVIMEAMAAGLPCVAPDVGDVGILLGSGEHGMLYPAGRFEAVSALLAELRAPDRYRRYADRARQRGLDFDIDRTCAILEGAIRRVIGERAAGEGR